MSITEQIKAVQRALNLDADGNAGPKTWAAIYKEVVGTTPADRPDSPDDGGAVDARSEVVIATLLSEVRPYARAFVSQAAQHGITIKLLSGLRTYAEQDALFAKGNVTKARGGYSNHNFGIAFDIGVFDGDRYLPESPLYKAAAPIGRALGLSWGGDWKSFVDEPHYQLRPPWAKAMSESEMLAELRRRHDTGIPVFA